MKIIINIRPGLNAQLWQNKYKVLYRRFRLSFFNRANWLLDNQVDLINIYHNQLKIYLRQRLIYAAIKARLSKSAP